MKGVNGHFVNNYRIVKFLGADAFILGSWISHKGAHLGLEGITIAYRIQLKGRSETAVVFEDNENFELVN